MLKNDEAYWKPAGREEAVTLSWGGSVGDFSRLWDHSKRRWEHTERVLRDAGLPAPGGRLVEFGAGMGLLDDLLGAQVEELLMIDNTRSYIEARSRPLSCRCRHILLDPESLARLQREEQGGYDWLVSIATFYHFDDATVVGLVTELGRLLAGGGYVLIRDWNESTPEALRAAGTAERLFSTYPRYFLDTDRIGAALAPSYEELHRDHGVLVYRKRSAT